jgi:hypothetical protein
MTVRGALAGISAILVVALVLGADLSTRPMAAEAQREMLADHPAVRHFTTSLARAVRELVGPRTPAPGGPAITAHLAWDLGLITPVGAPVSIARQARPVAVVLLLVSLLDLPPPSHA